MIIMYVYISRGSSHPIHVCFCFLPELHSPRDSQNPKSCGAQTSVAMLQWPYHPQINPNLGHGLDIFQHMSHMSLFCIMAGAMQCKSFCLMICMFVMLFLCNVHIFVFGIFSGTAWNPIPQKWWPCGKKFFGLKAQCMSRGRLARSCGRVFGGEKKQFPSKQWLGGGNSKICYFHPENWGNDPIWLIFLGWVVQPPTRWPNT